MKTPCDAGRSRRDRLSPHSTNQPTWFVLIANLGWALQLSTSPLFHSTFPLYRGKFKLDQTPQGWSPKSQNAVILFEEAVVVLTRSHICPCYRDLQATLISSITQSWFQLHWCGPGHHGDVIKWCHSQCSDPGPKAASVEKV